MSKLDVVFSILLSVVVVVFIYFLLFDLNFKSISIFLLNFLYFLNYLSSLFDLSFVLFASGIDYQ